MSTCFHSRLLVSTELFFSGSAARTGVPSAPVWREIRVQSVCGLEALSVTKQPRCWEMFPSVRLPSRSALLLRLSATSLKIKILLPENKIGPLVECVFFPVMAVFSISRLPLGECQGRQGASAGGTCSPGTQEVSWPHP